MYIHVTVTSNARREEIKEVKKLHFTVKVKEPAEENQANIRVRELVAAHLGVPRAKIRIVNGHHRSKKVLSIINSN
ncbi:MAG: DUF167 domain-containing protein [Parcubacteria group bacterium]|nr:DUF167 domain-containing protein [Parcubacteria group bacterium]